MKKIIFLFIVVLVLVVGWQGMKLYNQVNEPQLASQKEAQNYLQRNVEVTDVTYIDFFHGIDGYQVFQGKNNEEKAVFIWVADTLDFHYVEEVATGLTYEDVESFVDKELQPVELISIKLGMENKIPLYEIIYIDHKGRYSYHYIHFKDGKYLKHYHLSV